MEKLEEDLKKEPESPLHSDQGYSTDTSINLKYETPASPTESLHYKGNFHDSSSKPDLIQSMPYSNDISYQEPQNIHNEDVVMKTLNNMPYQFNESPSHMQSAFSEKYAYAISQGNFMKLQINFNFIYFLFFFLENSSQQFQNFMAPSYQTHQINEPIIPFVMETSEIAAFLEGYTCEELSFPDVIELESPKESNNNMSVCMSSTMNFLLPSSLDEFDF